MHDRSQATCRSYLKTSMVATAALAVGRASAQDEACEAASPTPRRAAGMKEQNT